MEKIYNNNGKTYYVLARMDTDDGNVLLLDDSKQYIVARNWSEKYRCWDAGSYFFAFEAAKDCFMDHAGRLLYDVV